MIHNILFIRILVLSVISGEKLKIVDRVHNYAPKIEKSLFLPTLTPPLPTKLNYLFPGPSECFETHDEIFKYKLCLLTNFTQLSISQFDQSAHVLGVFAGFFVENFRFSGLSFKYGDLAGCDQHRSAKITLKCGAEVKLENITEPDRCVYHGILELPTACDDDRLVVYPLMSTDGQKDWDTLASDHASGYLTQLGYDRELEKILIKEGFLLDNEKIQESEEFKVANEKSRIDREFSDEIEQLKAENLKLRSDLATCYSQGMDNDGDFDPMF